MYHLSFLKRQSLFSRLICTFVIISFSTSLITPPIKVEAQTLSGVNLPIPGSMLNVSPAFQPTLIKGIKIFPNNPLRFDFIVDPGDSDLTDQALQDESNKLIKYFLF